VKADVARVYDGNAIDLRFKLRDGTRSETRHLNTSPQLRVMVRGKPTQVNQLVVGDELTAYVKVYEPQLALIPAEPTVEPQFIQIQEVELPAQQEVAAAMPVTGGQTYTTALMAGFLLSCAAVLWGYRSRRPRD
jgi:LPXTG-motif cell wall-anchored protein